VAPVSAPAVSSDTVRPRRARRVAVVHFSPGWRDRVEGDACPGGRLEIVYDAERVGECFGSVAPSTVVAEAEFSPAGERRTRRLVGSRAAFAVPRGAVGVALWFHAESGDGGRVWDTRFGENYRYALTSTRP
jgi:hypothetical protein